MLITRRSPFTGKVHSKYLNVTQEQLDKYESGDELIQKVFPHLNAGEREFIKTGITPEEWEETFGGDEE